MKTVDYNVICEEDNNLTYIDLYWMEESDYNATLKMEMRMEHTGLIVGIH